MHESEVILMKERDACYNAKLTKYFARVITNRSINFYAKKFRQHEMKVLIEDPEQEHTRLKYPHEEANVSDVVIYNVKLSIESEKLEKIFHKLNAKEQFFVVQKFIFTLTDEEIGELLGISRSGITNYKHRFYKKVQ